MEEGLRPEDIRPGESETRIKNVEEAQVMAEAGNEHHSRAIKYRQWAEKEKKEGSDLASFSHDNAQSADSLAESLELAAQQIHRHPELVSMSFPGVIGRDPNYNGELNPKKLIGIKHGLDMYEKYNVKLGEMIQEVEQDSFRFNYLEYYSNQLFYCAEEKAEYQVRLRELRKNDNTTLGDIKKVFIDVVLKKIQSKLQETIESHKEYLSQFES